MCDIGHPGQVDLAAPRMKVQVSFGQLADLGESAANDDTRHRVSAEIFQHTAGKIAHVDHCVVRQTQQFLGFFLGRFSRTPGNQGFTPGAGDIDAAMDRFDPRSAGIGDNDAGRAQDRNPAENAEARVPGFLGQSCATFDRYGHDDVAGCAMGGGGLVDRLADHLSRHRVDRGLAHRQGQAFASYRADPVAGAEDDAVACTGDFDIYLDKCAVGDVGIVSCILDDGCKSAVFSYSFPRQGKGRCFTFRQGDLHGVGEIARQKRGIGSLGGRRRASAGRPSAS